jgi:hypothetical protein
MRIVTTRVLNFLVVAPHVHTPVEHLKTGKLIVGGQSKTICPLTVIPISLLERSTSLGPSEHGREERKGLWHIYRRIMPFRHNLTLPKGPKEKVFLEGLPGEGLSVLF